MPLHPVLRDREPAARLQDTPDLLEAGGADGRFDQLLRGGDQAAGQRVQRRRRQPLQRRGRGQLGQRHR